MAFNHLQLPGYNPGNALDFSSLNNAIDSNRENLLAQNRLGLQQRQVNLAERADARATEDHGAQQRQRSIQTFASHAQKIDAVADPAQRKAAWDRLIASHPDAAKLDPIYRDPMNGPKLVMQEAEGFMGRKETAQIGLIEAQAQKARREAANGGETPSNIREWQMFQRMSPEDQQRYLTMKRAEKYLDTGTGFYRPNPVQHGAPIAVIPKDVAGKAEQTALGQAQGQARAGLPQVEADSSRIIGQIDAVLNDPRLPSVTGWQARLPTYRSGSIDTEARIEQLGGAAFLQAFNSLKGGGQITEIEGKKATDAIARLSNLKQSDEGFRQALKEFRDEVVKLTQIAKQRAGGGGAAGAPAAPAPDPLGIR